MVEEPLGSPQLYSAFPEASIYLQPTPEQTVESLDKRGVEEELRPAIVMIGRRSPTIRQLSQPGPPHRHQSDWQNLPWQKMDEWQRPRCQGVMSL